MTERKSKIVLYTSDYRNKDIKRRREIRSITNTNLQNEHIDKIIILWEDWNTWKNDPEYSYLNNPKIEIIHCNKCPSYLNFYEHSKNNYSNDIILISNNDIIFDFTIGRLRECHFHPKKIYAITRLEPIKSQIDSALRRNPNQCYIDTEFSFDSYAFRHPLDIIPETIDIQLGLSGCDTYLIKKLIIDNLFEVSDPIFDIRTWHNQSSGEDDIKEYHKKYKYNSENDYPSNNVKYITGTQKYDGQNGLTLDLIGNTSFVTRNITIKRPLKVISFCLYGNNKKYTDGAIMNAEKALDIYPDWRCWFYIHQDSVPSDIINKLNEYPNVRIIFMQKLFIPMVWRFLPLDSPDVDIFISRDTDSIVSFREKAAVDEWISSGKRFHIIRDHPHHGMEVGIMGGMVGFRKMPYWKGWENIIKKYESRNGIFGLDMIILMNEVYPLASKYNDLYVSASFCRIESDCHDIPVEYDRDVHYIGEYWSSDGSRSQHHLDVIKDALTRGKEKNQCHRMKLGTILIYDDGSSKDKENAIVVGKAFDQLLDKENVQVLIKTIPQINGIPSSYIKEMMMVLGGCINYNFTEGGIMIVPSSLIPVRKYFFTELPKRFDDNRFISYHDSIKLHYNIATQKIWLQVWSENNNITPLDENNVIRIISQCWEHKINPNDILTSKLDKFLGKTGNLIKLDKDYTNYRTGQIGDKKCVDIKITEDTLSASSKIEENKCNDPTKLRVAVCLQVKNEQHILNEFIANYLHFGFDHIFIYDNMSNPPVTETLLPKFRKYVTVTLVTATKNVQPETYTHCCKTFGKDYDWIFNTDADEFLAFHQHKTVKEYLCQFDHNSIGAIAFHWILFGSRPYIDPPEGIDGYVKGTPTKLISESFVCSENKTDEHTYNRWQFIKQIYQPKAVNEDVKIPCCQVHYVHLKPGYKAIECDGSELKYRPNYCNTASFPKNGDELNKIAIIYHYYTLWEKFYTTKIARNKASYPQGQYDELEVLNKKCTTINTYYRDHVSPKLRIILGMTPIKSKLNKEKEVLLV